jgi:hypothetical protein
MSEMIANLLEGHPSATNRVAQACLLSTQRYNAEVFLIGDRGHERVNRPVGAIPRSVIKKRLC